MSSNHIPVTAAIGTYLADGAPRTVTIPAREWVDLIDCESVRNRAWDVMRKAEKGYVGIVRKPTVVEEVSYILFGEKK